MERKYHHLEVGFNSRLDGLQAVPPRVKLDHWSDMIARRQAAAVRYDGAAGWLKAGSHMRRFGRRSSTHLFHQYCVLLPEGTDRDALRATC